MPRIDRTDSKRFSSEALDKIKSLFHEPGLYSVKEISQWSANMYHHVEESNELRSFKPSSEDTDLPESETLPQISDTSLRPFSVPEMASHINHWTPILLLPYWAFRKVEVFQKEIVYNCLQKCVIDGKYAWISVIIVGQHERCKILLRSLRRSGLNIVLNPLSSK